MSDYETNYTTSVPPALQKHVDEMVERFMEELTIATAAEQVLGFTKGMVLAAYCWQYPPHGIEAMQPGAVQRPGEPLIEAAKRSNIIEMSVPAKNDALLRLLNDVQGGRVSLYDAHAQITADSQEAAHAFYEQGYRYGKFGELPADQEDTDERRAGSGVEETPDA